MEGYPIFSVVSFRDRHVSRFEIPVSFRDSSSRQTTRLSGWISRRFEKRNGYFIQRHDEFSGETAVSIGDTANASDFTASRLAKTRFVNPLVAWEGLLVLSIDTSSGRIRRPSIARPSGPKPLSRRWLPDPFGALAGSDASVPAPTFLETLSSVSSCADRPVPGRRPRVHPTPCRVPAPVRCGSARSA